MFGMLGHVLHNVGSAPATRLYPFEKREPFKDARGHIVCDIDKCIFCTLCDKVCPSNCLKVDRVNKTWDLDPYACIVCGVCVESCRKGALSVDPIHTKAVQEKQDIVLTAPPVEPVAENAEAAEKPAE